MYICTHISRPYVPNSTCCEQVYKYICVLYVYIYVYFNMIYIKTHTHIYVYTYTHIYIYNYKFAIFQNCNLSGEFNTRSFFRRLSAQIQIHFCIYVYNTNSTLTDSPINIASHHVNTNSNI